jgi:3-hydroxybutyrate dehydrogenase
MNIGTKNIATKATVMQAPLKEKVALVTGSTSGIGLGIARALAAAGAAIVLNGFGKRDEIEATQQALSSDFGVQVAYSAADMSKPDSIAEMIGMTLDRFGRLDVLVNNAGIQHVAPLQEFPVAKWDAILAINLSSAFHTIRLALPSMLANKWGRIINIASAHGLVGSPYKAAYVAAKHGMLGLTKVTALETAEHGITCNAICPGYVYTPLVEMQIEGQAKAHGIPREQVIREVLLAQQPNKRFATTEELGGIAAFLASSAAASITGAAIPVDGGWTAH